MTIHIKSAGVKHWEECQGGKPWHFLLDGWFCADPWAGVTVLERELLLAKSLCGIQEPPYPWVWSWSHSLALGTGACLAWLGSLDYEGYALCYSRWPDNMPTSPCGFWPTTGIGYSIAYKTSVMVCLLDTPPSAWLQLIWYGLSFQL